VPQSRNCGAHDVINRAPYRLLTQHMHCTLHLWGLPSVPASTAHVNTASAHTWEQTNRRGLALKEGNNRPCICTRVRGLCIVCTPLPLCLAKPAARVPGDNLICNPSHSPPGGGEGGRKQRINEQKAKELKHCTTRHITSQCDGCITYSKDTLQHNESLQAKAYHITI
jgi:hypothetical protein